MEFELLSEKLGRFAEKGENARRLRSSAGKTSELGILEFWNLGFGGFSEFRVLKAKSFFLEVWALNGGRRVYQELYQTVSQCHCTVTVTRRRFHKATSL